MNINLLINPNSIIVGINLYINLFCEVIRAGFGSKINYENSFPPFLFFIINSIISILLLSDIHVLMDAILDTMNYSGNFIFIIGYFSFFLGFLFFYVVLAIFLKIGKKNINPHGFMRSYCYASATYLIVFLYLNILQFIFAGLIFVISKFSPLLVFEYLDVFIWVFCFILLLTCAIIPFYYWIRIFSYYYKIYDNSKFDIKKYAWGVIILTLLFTFVINKTGIFDVYDNFGDRSAHISPYSSFYKDEYGTMITKYPTFTSDIEFYDNHIVAPIYAYKNYMFHLVYLNLLNKAEEQINIQYKNGKYDRENNYLFYFAVSSYDSLPVDIRYAAKLKTLAAILLNEKGYHTFIEDPSQNNINSLEKICDDIKNQRIMFGKSEQDRQLLIKEIKDAENLKKIVSYKKSMHVQQNQTIGDVLNYDWQHCNIYTLLFKINCQNVELRVIPII